MTKFKVEVFVRFPKVKEHTGRSFRNMVEVWADTPAEARYFATQNVVFGLTNAEATAAEVITLGLVQ